MSGRTGYEALPGVFHIRDHMGVYMTLLAGEREALLIDTGYGLENPMEYVRTLTDRPVRVLLTHAHHDHALGARWFEKTWMFPEDREAFSVYSGPDIRRNVARQAAEKGIHVSDEFLTATIPVPEPAEEGTLDLGGMTAQIILCPGHTPGSAVVYVPERKLLITGDNWNPCTWLFFPEALPAQQFRENMRRVMQLPFEKVICPHREPVYPREMIDAFFAGLTDDVLRAARPTEMGWDIDTREAVPAEGQQLVFDYGKTALDTGR
ncbi:MAG: MBL fold metallo-hydrolase [Clostridia bacterium]|nr:MBL fold metallo-hydrolase [Clostridia bacterium]